MGNCCGKEETDGFSQPGRVLGSAPPDPAAANTNTNNTSGTSPVPKKVGGPARTLGGSPDTSLGSAQVDARRRAAEAAEARAKTSGKPAGKLQSQLAAQKKQTRSDTLREASNQERRERDADDNAQARNWD